MESQPQNPEFKSNPVYRQILFIKLGRMNVLSQITIEIKKIYRFIVTRYFFFYFAGSACVRIPMLYLLVI